MWREKISRETLHIQLSWHSLRETNFQLCDETRKYLVWNVTFSLLPTILYRFRQIENCVRELEREYPERLYIQLSRQSISRVAKCHRYGRLICVNFLEIWCEILECNIRASDVG